MSVIDNTVRIYDLARELKQEPKCIIEDLRREGADVDVPSNSVGKELADKIRNKYFPKIEISPKRGLKLIRKKIVKANAVGISQIAENKTEIIETQPTIKRNIMQSSAKVTDKNLATEKTANSQKEVSNTPFIIDCQECPRPTKHNLIHSVDAINIDWNEKYQIVQCMLCESLSFRRITLKHNQANDKEEINLYPSRIKGRQKLRLASIPPIIEQIYEEVYLALSNNLLIVATTGMRTLIELICKDQGSTAGNLKGKIDDLVTRELLTRKNANNLHKLRDFGNDAAHEANIQSENTLKRCMDIIEHLLEDIYLPEISS